ncbi:3-phosphoserine/phosphohydroxythreonine transaminase [Membranihabitans maritimus]|uniref:3-phosphoserine/phosphohydroxythreonine transaminase n=1 Tax=Membranihabitans maritimus TaxID=2904244 RepID=UPI001EFF6379|nr:3-phosphoserine/phosphohydroxythreonine transaminase [Membranihabitans maritimus]
MKKHNFYAGPAILAEEVKQESSKAALDYQGTGLSLMEMSHRSPEVSAIMDEATSLIKELLNIPEGYQVLFLQGGASLQFYMTALNLLDSNGTASYIDTGSWSTKAIKEAKRCGNIEVVASSKDKNYNYIPKNVPISANSSYLHITTNNTIFGTQYQDMPSYDIPLVADMSSDIFSRPFDVSKFDVIYAGAQKNLGPAGCTLVIVREGALGKVSRELPSMLDYKIHIGKGSLFNTGPVFPIYVSLLTLRWLKKNGGINGMVQRNAAKAQALYDEIDRNSLFYGTAEKEDRSKMNVCFLLHDESMSDEFLKDCKEANIVGVKGHRSVGGFRASIYNAMEKDSVDHLINIMQAFEKKMG